MLLVFVNGTLRREGENNDYVWTEEGLLRFNYRLDWMRDQVRVFQVPAKELTGVQYTDYTDTERLGWTKVVESLHTEPRDPGLENVGRVMAEGLMKDMERIFKKGQTMETENEAKTTETEETTPEKKFETPGYVIAPVSKLFRFTNQEGVVEKVFVDHVAKPQRAYPTGEYYEAVEEGEDLEGKETVTITNPMDFEPVRFKRISDIPEDCIIQDSKE